MIDPKVITLLTLLEAGSYTNAAKILSLTQPAVSRHIQLLEEEYGIKIFHKNKKGLKPTQEGEILIKYARRLMTIAENSKQALEDNKKSIRRLSVGITATLGEYLVSKVFATYCNENPGVHINILTDNIKKVYNLLESYELDLAIVEGNISNEKYTSILLDTDYLCLVVSPEHSFASRKSVSLQELKKEKFILRSPNAGTRSLFENHLLSRSENIKNFNIIIEIDNITTIKELVASNLGITIMAYSACKEEEADGQLVVVPIENMNMIREINLVCHKDFKHAEIIDDLRRIYNSCRL